MRVTKNKKPTIDDIDWKEIIRRLDSDEDGDDDIYCDECDCFECDQRADPYSCVKGIECDWKDEMCYECPVRVAL